MTPRIAAFWLAVSLVTASFVTASVVPVVAAQAQAPAAQPPSGGQGDFVPAKDLPQQETIPAAPLVMAAYGFVWAALLVYVWTVWRRLLKVEKDVKELSARLASKPGSRN